MTNKPDVKNVWASLPTSNVIAPDESKVLEGWVKEIPPHEWFNWEMNRQGSFSAYVNEIGVPEWDSTTEYKANRSITNRNGVMYVCQQDNINKDPITETLYWSVYGFVGWKVVDSGYTAVAGDKILLNNRTESQSVVLPSEANYGDEIQIYPYPFTKYSFKNLVVSSTAPIMGLQESMTVSEDNVVFSCKYVGKLIGWIVEKLGIAGKPDRRNTFLGASYGAGAQRIYDAHIVDGAPLVLLVHGGGWTAGSKDNANFEGGNYVLYFPQKYNLSFAAINYTLATDVVKSFPTAVNDIILAAEHIKAAHGVKSIHLVGSSAGANLGALAAIERPDLFDSFVGYYGVYNLDATSQIDPSLYDDIAKYTSNTFAASPINRANELTIPAYLVHDSGDTLINVQQTLDFATALNVVPDIVSGQSPTHGFKLFGDYQSNDMPAFAKRVFKFIDKVGEA